jgi:hypothetical protein
MQPHLLFDRAMRLSITYPTQPRPGRTSCQRGAEFIGADSGTLIQLAGHVSTRGSRLISNGLDFYLGADHVLHL